MMFFQDGQFPRCGEIIRSRILKLGRSSRIYLSFIECCEDARIAADAFKPGTYPKVVIRTISARGMIPRGIYNGQCVGGSLNEIAIHTVTARGLENDENWEAYLDTSSDFEKVLLHEAVHWARFIGGKPSEIDLSGKKILAPGERKTAEAGSWFDFRAFGIPYAYHGAMECTYGERTLEEALVAERDRLKGKNK